MFQKILIANRGEIACRIMETARRLNIRTVAIYSDADKSAKHTQMADEAYRVGGTAAQESYLKIENIMDVLRRCGAEAVHPGYGFLSENANFAEAVQQAKRIFIGPPASAIRAMGSKIEAKKLMEAAGVPILPGHHRADQQDDKILLQAAQRIGFPILIKAAAGGGGKGMRRVDQPADFMAALASARREARAAFGDEAVLVEKYLLSPRHIEIQVFADQQGNIVHLFERECSIQRRHQKVIEEAPSVLVTPKLRQEMGQVAINAAKAVGYQGAGTVEFIVDQQGRFYFMEMNTRLQVEHRVTEKITGQDLVEWQLLVASGKPLPLSQKELKIHGHSIQARLYAEDPDRDFLPSSGHVHYLQLPKAAAEHILVDCAIRPGDDVTIHYDPMMMKMVSWAEDREKAVKNLSAALSDTIVLGVTNNIHFLRAVLNHSAFVKGTIDTHFIQTYQQDLLPKPSPSLQEKLALLATADFLKKREAQAISSPWYDGHNWRANHIQAETLSFKGQDQETQVYVQKNRDKSLPWSIRINQQVFEVGIVSGNQTNLVIEFANDRWNIPTYWNQQEFYATMDSKNYKLTYIDPLKVVAADEVGVITKLTAPMPGKISQIFVKVGDKVEKSTALLVLEAMKMEHTIRAPAEGKIAQILCQTGQFVQENSSLIKFE